MAEAIPQENLQNDQHLSQIRELEQQIQDSNRMKEALEERLQFEKLLSEISSAYTNLPASEVDKTIEYGLQRLGKFLGADRCNLAQLTESESAVRIFHSWGDDGIAPLPDFLVGTRDYFPWTIDRLKRGEVVKFTRTEDLPDEAAIDKKNFILFDYKSQIAVPISVGGYIVGALGLDTVRACLTYTEETVDRLRRAGAGPRRSRWTCAS